MKTIKVTYTVKQAFAQQNQENVQAFIKDLEKINHPAIRYIAYRGEDGKTFTHIASYESDEGQKVLFGLESFRSFQQQRDDSGLEVAPRIETIETVAASYNQFQEV
jgi:hypothetical protein